MRLVHVTSSLVRASAGVREVVLGLAREQRLQGVDVAVLGLDHPDWAQERERDEWTGVPTQVARVRGPRALGYAPEMTAILQKMDPDVVHLHGLWMHPGRSVLQWHRATRRPYIVAPHGMLSKVALSYSPWKKRAVSAWFQDAVFERAARLHVTSESEQAEIRDYGLNAPACIVPNGVAEISRPKDLASQAGRTILSLGRIHKKKALDHLILAWHGLQAAFPDWSLQIVGPDEEGEAHRLSALVAHAGVQRVEMRGPVYGSEKQRLMASAGIFALPTLSENFAITVAESLMLEVPVVSSHGAPWSGLNVERCGLWVPIGVQHMAKALSQLMSLTDTERLEMGARGRSWMLRDFSWNAVSRQMNNCYASLKFVSS